MVVTSAPSNKLALTSTTPPRTTSQVKLNTYEPSYTSFESDEAFFSSDDVTSIKAQEGSHILSFEGLNPLKVPAGAEFL